MLQILSNINESHKNALNWFANNTGNTCSWSEFEAQAEKGNRLATLAKGIYKPAYTDYSLSVRQTLNSPYADKEIIYRADGSWIYPYYQENSNPGNRDREATNRGLMNCMKDNVPIGVLIQKKPKPGVEYLVLGLGNIIDWQNGYFIIESFGYKSSTLSQKDATRIRVSADLAPIFPTEPSENIREWQIQQVLKRRGQSKFRKTLLSAYCGACAISECDAIDALQAAHIAPYSETINNQTSNGLLLRADLHTLFDLGLLGVEPVGMSVVLTPTLKTSSYGDLQGKALRMPKNQKDWPDPEKLRNHLLWSQLI